MLTFMVNNIDMIPIIRIYFSIFHHTKEARPFQCSAHPLIKKEIKGVIETKSRLSIIFYRAI